MTWALHGRPHVSPLLSNAQMVTTTQRLAARSLAFDLPAEIHTTCRRLAQGRVGRTLIKEADSRLVLTVVKGGHDPIAWTPSAR
jgi:hypothetical protein